MDRAEAKFKESIKEIVAGIYGHIGKSEVALQLGAANTLDWGYSAQDLDSIPAAAQLGLSCGNPLAIAPLNVGDIVVDLGSGAGFDSLLAARRVGDQGRVIGVDFAPEMVERAVANALACHCMNAEFRIGDIEALPIVSDSVDVVTSNCALNLVPDKKKHSAKLSEFLSQVGTLSLRTPYSLVLFRIGRQTPRGFMRAAYREQSQSRNTFGYLRKPG